MLPDSTSLPTMNPRFCPRTETVRELASMLNQFRVVHIRGTPASGKTTLAYLLRDHFVSQDVPTIMLTQYPPYDYKHDYTNVLVEKVKECGYHSVDRYNLMNLNVVFILDEAQQTYCDTGLWNGLIKTQSGLVWGPRICLFSVYGSPFSGAEEYQFSCTPVRFGDNQRVSIAVSNLESAPPISLFYSRCEFDDVVQRRSIDVEQPLPLDEEACNYIFTLTNGHPGAVASVFEMLFMLYRSDIEHGRIPEIKEHHIISALDDEDKAFRSLKRMQIGRSFVTLRGLPIAAANVLREALVNNNIPQDRGNEGLQICYKNGWLHAEPTDSITEESVCVFPTRLHAKFVERYLTGRTEPFPIDKFLTIEALAEAVLRRFSIRNLTSAAQIGTAAMKRPVEATYRDEFYRALQTLLGFSSGVSSEWSGDGNGRIDFMISDIGWGIEILRDGDGLKDHCERFVGDGSYTSRIQKGYLKDWLILDCRTSQPRPYDVPGTKLWRVVFASDFMSFQILDVANKPLGPIVPLTS